MVEFVLHLPRNRKTICYGKCFGGDTRMLNSVQIRRLLDQKEKPPHTAEVSFWRRHPDLNRGIKVLQTHALPLGYVAI